MPCRWQSGYSTQPASLSGSDGPLGANDLAESPRVLAPSPVIYGLFVLKYDSQSINLDGELDQLVNQEAMELLFINPSNFHYPFASIIVLFRT